MLLINAKNPGYFIFTDGAYLLLALVIALTTAIDFASPHYFPYPNGTHVVPAPSGWNKPSWVFAAQRDRLPRAQTTTHVSIRGCVASRRLCRLARI